MFERPILLWVMLASPLVIWPAVLTSRAGRSIAGLCSGLARLLCFAAVVFTLAGLKLPVHGNAARMTLVVALDESRSIAPDQRAWMMRRIGEVRRAMDTRDRLAIMGFA